MQRSTVSSWKLSSGLESELEEAARDRQQSVAELLEEIARDWLERHREREVAAAAQQEEIRAAAMKVVGAIKGGDPDRAQNSRSEIRARLARRYGR